jgi:hypothetical protein
VRSVHRSRMRRGLPVPLLKGRAFQFGSQPAAPSCTESEATRASPKRPPAPWTGWHKGGGSPASGFLSALPHFMHTNRRPPFPPAVVPLPKTAKQPQAFAKGNQRFFLCQMRTEKRPAAGRGVQSSCHLPRTVLSPRHSCHASRCLKPFFLKKRVARPI